MIDYNIDYLQEVEMLNNAKREELQTAKEEHDALRVRPDLFSGEENFILPQGKKVKLVLELGGTHKFIDCGQLRFDVSKYCKLPVYHPFTRLEFTIHGVGHSENQVIALHSKCPAELQLIASWTLGWRRCFTVAQHCSRFGRCYV